jgi:two-component system CheB/CheR fusion protein
VGAVANLFTTVDRAHKIFCRKASASRQVVTFSLNPQAERGEYGAVRTPLKQPDSAWNYLEAQKEFDRRLLAQYAPAAVFVNEDLEIIHTRGNVSRYLKLASGRASLSVLKMAREGLLYDLRNAILRAKKEKKPVRREKIQIKNGNGEGDGHGSHERSTKATRLVNMEVVPVRLGNSDESYFMILFQDATSEQVTKPAPGRAARIAVDSRREAGRITKLEEELAATKDYLQSVIETQEATNEELQSANEETLSSNEELQSTNEELETAKEELQSANEELTTVNDELRSRNNEVTQINNDLTNLFSSLDLAVVMIGTDLNVRRFTPRAEKAMGLAATDIGRPFLNINPTVEIADLQQMLLQAIATFRSAEKDITGRDGSRYHVRIVPYHTGEDNHNGAVMTLIDAAAQPQT